MRVLVGVLMVVILIVGLVMVFWVVGSKCLMKCMRVALGSEDTLFNLGREMPY